MLDPVDRMLHISYAARAILLVLPRSMQSRPSALTSLGAIAAYVVLALVFSWPLPQHMATNLTGPPDGDTGVYVWNQWVFQHELLDHRSLPLFTHEIFSLTRPANLSLHNYTIFQDLLALPLLRVFGVVTTFNVVYLLMIVLTGYAAFLLAWHVTNRPVESWLAGALFSWSPWIVTRGIGHFSLVAAAPLAIFILLLLKSSERARMRDALALGATVCWAATTDPYYAVYCVMIAVVFLCVRTVRVTRAAARATNAGLRTLDLVVACMGGFVVALLIGHGWKLTVLGVKVSVQGLYTPMLILTLLVLLRLAWPYRHAAVSVDRGQIFRLTTLASATALVAFVMLSPVLYAVGVRIRDTGFESSAVLWRSSPPGVDLVTFLLPNPNHPLASAALRTWLTPQPDRYLENVASLTFVAIGVIIAAIRTGWRPSAFWIALTITFGLLSLGPFVHIAGFNTHIPGPWALARYLPLVRLARTPARLAVVLMLAVSVLFGAALCRLGDRWPHRRRLLLATLTVVLLFELLPAPRPLYSAAVPPLYERIAATPGEQLVLELPVGVRDGTTSVGNFTARAQFFQTVHGKPLIGGYLSRVSRRRIAEVRQFEILDALMTLSEGRRIESATEHALISRGPKFVRDSHIGFVVVDRKRASADLTTFAIRALSLRRIDGDAQFDLYTPGGNVR